MIVSVALHRLSLESVTGLAYRASVICAAVSAHFERVYLHLTPPYTFLELKRSKFKPMKTTLVMVQISYANCLGPSLVSSAQFALEMCVAAQHRTKFQ